MDEKNSILFFLFQHIYLAMFDRELLNSYKFSLLETSNTDAKNTIINMTGVNVMIVMFV